MQVTCQERPGTLWALSKWVLPACVLTGQWEKRAHQGQKKLQYLGQVKGPQQGQKGDVESVIPTNQEQGQGRGYVREGEQLPRWAQ